MQILLPDGTQSSFPSKIRTKTQLFEDEKRYADFLKFTLQACRLDADSCCYMLNSSTDSPGVEIIIPCLPSRSDVFSADQTKRFLLCTACQQYVSKGLDFLEPQSAQHVHQINDFILSNKHGLPINDGQRNIVDTIFSSEGMTTHLLDQLLSSSALRYQWMRVRGKSGKPYKLRICDTDLAICEDIGDAVPIRVWSWTELGPAKATKAEVRIPWILSSSTDNLPAALNDVLTSLTPMPVKYPTSAGDAPIKAAFQFTICLSTADATAGARLVRQLACARGMALRNTSPTGNRDSLLPVQPQEEGAETSPARKSGRRWLCGLRLCRKPRGKETRSRKALLSPPPPSAAVTSALPPPPHQPITLQAHVTPVEASPPLQQSSTAVPPTPQPLSATTAATFAAACRQHPTPSPPEAVIVAGAAGEAEAELDEKTVQDLDMDAAKMCSGGPKPVVELSPRTDHETAETPFVNVEVHTATAKGLSTPLREYNLQTQDARPSLSPLSNGRDESQGLSGATADLSLPEPPAFEPSTSSFRSSHPVGDTGSSSSCHNSVEPVLDQMPEPPSPVAHVAETAVAASAADTSTEVNVVKTGGCPGRSAVPSVFPDSAEQSPVGAGKLPAIPNSEISPKPPEEQSVPAPESTSQTIPPAPRSPGKFSAIPLPRNPTRAMSVPIGDIQTRSTSASVLHQPTEESPGETTNDHSRSPLADGPGQPPSPDMNTPVVEKKRLPSVGCVRSPEPNTTAVASSSTSSSLETTSETAATTKRYASLGYTPRSPEHQPRPPVVVPAAEASGTTKRYASLGYSRPSESTGASPQPMLEGKRMASLGYTPRSVDPVASSNGTSPTQAKPLGLIEPKVVVKKTSTNSSKPVGSSKLTASPQPTIAVADPAEYDMPVNDTTTGQSPAPARPVTSGIRPPAVFTDVALPRYKSPTSRTAPPPDTISPSTSNGVSTSRSDPPPTGIRLPSRLPRQALAK